MSSATVNGSFFSGGVSLPVTVGGSSPSQPSSNASASLSLGISTGGVVAGSPVSISASGLQSSAPYTVVVQSTPQTIGSGNAVSGAVNTSVTLPSGLEAGWHTLTFTSTAADGSTITSVTYFKVSSNGTLLSTSSSIPAELANTGMSDITWQLGEITLALIGFGILLFIRQRKRNA
jgi:methionine-rich copper-binding protein CopC